MRHDIERDEWLRGKIEEDLEAMAEKRERRLRESAEELRDVDIPMGRLEDIYRRIEEEERALRKNRISKRMVIALAATVVLCIGAGAIGVGSRVYEPKILQSMRGDEVETKVENTDSLYREYDEEEVCQEIKEKLGIVPVRLSYQPVGMNLSNYWIKQKTNEALVKYELDGKWLYIYISKDYSESSISYQTDGENVGTVIIESYNLSIPVFKYKNPQSEIYFEGSFEYLNTYYSVSGMMEFEELKKIIENISLKNV